MQEAGVATILHCLMKDVHCIVCVCVGGGSGWKGKEEEVEIHRKKRGQEKVKNSRLSIFPC